MCDATTAPVELVSIMCVCVGGGGGGRGARCGLYV